VKIPIAVTGAEAAKQQLGGVSTSLQGVAQAGQAASAANAAAAATAATAAQQAQQSAVTLANAEAATGAVVAANTETTKKASGAVGDLLTHKEKLSQVVSLLGGSFGAQAGQLGTVLQMITTLNPALIVTAAGMAALTAGVKVFRDLAEATRQAREELEKYAAAEQELREEHVGTAGKVDEGLLRLGGLDAQASAGALSLVQEMRKLGIDEQRAVEVAPQAYLAGITPREAALVAVGGGMEGATVPQTPADVLAALQRLGPAQRAALEQQLDALGGTGMGRRAAGEAARLDYLFGHDPEKMKRLLEADPREVVREGAVKLGLVPEKTTAEEVEEMARSVQQKQMRLRERSEANAAAAAVGGFPDTISFSGLEAEIEKGLRIRELRSTTLQFLTNLRRGQAAPGAAAAERIGAAFKEDGGRTSESGLERGINHGKAAADLEPLVPTVKSQSITYNTYFGQAYFASPGEVERNRGMSAAPPEMQMD
jgi:hypothetical protein